MTIEVLKSIRTPLGNRVKLVSPCCRRDTGKVLIIGVFHGDEPQGEYLINKYLEYFKSNTCKNSLLFIPCLNPDGMMLNTRTNANGVDLNRNFPTSNWGQNEGENANCDDETAEYYGGKYPASESETRFVIQIIEEYKPGIILTLHSPYKVVNFDGPAQSIAEKISQITGYPVRESIGYSTPGSFGTYCGVERNIPVITLELDEKVPAAELLQPVSNVFNYISAA